MSQASGAAARPIALRRPQRVGLRGIALQGSCVGSGEIAIEVAQSLRSTNGPFHGIVRLCTVETLGRSGCRGERNPEDQCNADTATCNSRRGADMTVT